MQKMDHSVRIEIFRFGLLAAALTISGKPSLLWVLAAFAIYRIMRSDFAQRAGKTLKRDLKGLYLLVRIKLEIKKRLAANRPVHEIWLERVNEHPQKEAAVEIETGRRISYRELNELMNKYANFFSSQGYKYGDVVALFMENNIEFIAAWFGLSKIGVVSAFINTNLKLEPLGHSINVSKCKCVITMSTLLPMLDSTKKEGVIANNMKVYLCDGEVPTAENLKKSLVTASENEPPNCPELNFQSVLCYIYTSGTTGFPKPSVIKHCRFYWAACSSSEGFGVKKEDVLYITMPFYHSAASMLGVGTIISKGTSIVIRKKFSASNFWKIRTMYGNGLRREIWVEFTTRFGIKRVGELYGATEGISNLANLDNHVGSCGFFPIYPFTSLFYPVRLVKVDEETGEIIRNKKGLAVPCQPGESGEMVGIINNKDVFRRFDGYVDKGDTEKKIYRDVFQKGDMCFASGDVLHWDELGYLYFKDRKGDTFRWKGENVSTIEVEGILQPIKSIVVCTVYGVEVGKQEGRAGMTALQMEDGADLKELLSEAAQRFTANLASYAIPIFIRICKEVEKTGSYKLKKTDLQKAGFDLSKGMDNPFRADLFRLGALVAVLSIVNRKSWWIVLAAFALYRLMRTDFARRARKTLKRDITGIMLLIRIKRELNKRIKANQPSHEMWMERVRENPLKEAAVEVETGRSITFRDMNQLMNKYANYFKGLGYKHGDVVALFMENNIDFLAIWLGLSKIGVVSAFINTNLKLEPLAHSINVSKSKCIITTTTLLPTLDKAKAEGLVNKDMKAFVNSGDVDTAENLEENMKGTNGDEPQKCKDLDFTSVLCYIYTSGTTGFPKPAVIKHCRYSLAITAAVEAFGIKIEDRIYITMPFYHSAASILGAGALVARGSTIVIRKKFSATNFWKDAIAHNCTCSQYIGEICRYLIAQKPTSEEKQHKIRTMYGNGLRREIWTEFTSRFGIERIVELYAATEGNSNTMNLDNHVGSCGFMPIYPFMWAFSPLRLLKIDEETGQLIRDKNGLAIPCNPGETGEMVGVINNKDLMQRFDGYVGKEETNKKIYRDVFKKGDQVFASGDVLHWDELGYLYFKDRKGDTYRWKGENVSTIEVEGILQPIKSIVECTVYGVEVPKQEGRAGMTALQMVDGEDLEELLADAAKRFTANLASYAIPIFIRICKEVDKTGTYKLRKTELQKAGYDLAKVDNDPVYIFNSSERKYVPLTAALQKQIDSGEYTRI
ncbi:hypothetical protein PRIPAC_80092 [Pristionchus pacificus]|uniref:Long-chain-fatty-acid--CoA ligase n=1 Tax=Pristionchus pacificus TaxID=54126 RepID=A0A8R1YPA0_PRIPA|nr:hypothetical protein PRIPAC_80092 [Pristionchus pacificus]|eukprot:PDM72149.1 AMP-binding protein [Pristionchus pacificus]